MVYIPPAILEEKPKTQLLEYLFHEHSYSETLHFALNEKLCKSKDTLRSWIESFEEYNWITVRKTQIRFRGEPSVFYKATELGNKQVNEFKTAITEGKWIHPDRHTNISITIGTDNKQGLVDLAMAKKLAAQLKDPELQSSLASILESIIYTYGESLTNETPFDSGIVKENTNYDGRFTNDGRFVLTAIFSRDESIKFREMISSGHFESSNEPMHVAQLLLLAGSIFVRGLYSESQRNNFDPNLIYSQPLALSLEKDGKFKHRFEALDYKEFLRKLKENPLPEQALD